ncbi:MAG TPA: glutamine amidotransferase [Candidatus Paceibacterota bacterium]|nr:glutamine amidotransferase [Candidatus Paceibacterota bacterium]
MLAQVTISSPGWLWPALLLAAVCLAALVSSYRSGPVAGPRLPCALLKALGVTALALCLLEPLWSTRHARPGANLFVIAADNSQSLEVKDTGAAQSRADALRQALEPNTGWQTALDDLFETRRFLFDTRLQAVPDFAALTFDGRVTALGTALRGLADRYAGQPLAGVLLFTDGNATDALEGSLNLDGLPPIYPVVLGRPGAARDLAIAQVHVSQTAFEDAPVSIQVDIAASGSRGETVTAQLLGPDGLEVGAQTVRARKDNDTLSCRFQLRPDKPGLSFYRVRVGFSSELEAASAAPTAAPSTREATLVNNTRTVPVERRSEPHRILYVAGRPNWEYKFLNRALETDDQLQLVALMRVALREPKFEFRGRAGETSNPLFRGFGDQSREEAARYDEPVLVRLNTRDELELRGGFPRTPEELYGFDALVLDDLEAAFFGPDQALLIAKFVSERGGGLLMLGGAESFHHGGYQRTPIGDMLPVYLDRLDSPQNPPTLRWDLAREGWLEPWARLRDTETAEKEQRQTMPAFHVLNSVRSVKPGARIIATATDEHGAQHPALVTQRFGRGRTAALMVGDVWRWGMRDASARNDMERTWRQLLRWLVADVPRPVELAIETPADQPAEAVRLEVRARDARFQPLDDASVTIEVEPGSAQTHPAALTNELRKDGDPGPQDPAGQGPSNTPSPQAAISPIAGPIRLRAEPSTTESGLYEATYVPCHNGGYRATACVTNLVGVEAGRAVAGWNTDLAADEFRSIDPNVPLIESIARRTGGEIVPLGKLAEFARGLPARRAPVMEAVTRPVWHTPWLFAFALACFLAEWGLRRWKGWP